MKFKRISVVILCMLSNYLYSQSVSNHDYPISSVPFTSVQINDQFWGSRLKANKEVTIPLAFSKCEETGRYENFVKASHPSSTYKFEGLTFDDTDVYKTIEGASYTLQTFPDKKLENYIDSLITLIAAAQEEDGYLYTARTMNPDDPHEWAGHARWEKEEELSHELYNLGHLIEGAIAHYQATGKRSLLDIAIKYAECAENEIGVEEGKVCVVPGHQIAEMALAKLYVITGDKKHLDFAKFLLDYRGKTHHHSEYSQSHIPVTEQDEAVGHAVRAAYMYTGMADIAALTGDSSYIKAIDRIWENIVGRKIYITGGIGSTSSGEAFGDDYELPNMSAYCETCAAIGNVYLNHRLFLLHGESKYYDVLERTLYNGLISGVSMDGGTFFYPNPLESMGQHQRQPWFGCACCPSNISRFIPSVPGYVYAVKDDNLFVNLFVANKANINILGSDLKITQATNYPWEGVIDITIDSRFSKKFKLNIRIPGWAQNKVVPGDLYEFVDDLKPEYKVTVNGTEVNSTLKNGYFVIERNWKKGDKVEVYLSMESRLIKSKNKVKADHGMVSIERGPLVYCAEWPDNDFSLRSVVLSKEPKFKASYLDDKLNGIYELETAAQALSYDSLGNLGINEVALKMIPYYAWAHRGSGNMSVWIANDVQAVRPEASPSIASESLVEASHKTKALKAVSDGQFPMDVDDHSAPYYHWWPKEGTTEWISYTFNEEHLVSTSSVYWFDDAPWGGCRVPKSWKLYYQESASGDWKEVNSEEDYGTEKFKLNKIHFTPVKTKAMKLEVILPDKNASGLYEWSVE